MTTNPLDRTVWDLTTVESRFARQITARLSQSTSDLPHNLSERLRVAREHALEHGRWATTAQLQGRTAASFGVSGKDEAVMRGAPSWGWRLASLLPVVAMVAGLLLVQSEQDAEQVHAAIDIDAALLSDDLPPTAYSDAGFAEFLRDPTR